MSEGSHLGRSHLPHTLFSAMYFAQIQDLSCTALQQGHIYIAQWKVILNCNALVVLVELLGASRCNLVKSYYFLV